MPFRVQFVPHPPEIHLECTIEQLARRDARFAHPRRLRARGVMGLVVQDSADQLSTHLVVSDGHSSWSGSPGQLDEDGRPGQRPYRGWSRCALDYGLALDLEPTIQKSLTVTELCGCVGGLQRGVVYLLRRESADAEPLVTRRFNLSNFFDRSEWDSLVDAAFPGFDLLRVQLLAPDGQQVLLEAALTFQEEGSGRPQPRT